LGLFHVEIGGDIPEDHVKRSDANFSVRGNGHVVLSPFAEEVRRTWLPV